MGECLIVRRGGESYELPVLSASYPRDVTVTAAAGASEIISRRRQIRRASASSSGVYMVSPHFSSLA